MIARHSFSVVVQSTSAGISLRLSHATGRLSCMCTTPLPHSHASVTGREDSQEEAASGVWCRRPIQALCTPCGQVSAINGSLLPLVVEGIFKRTLRDLDSEPRSSARGSSCGWLRSTRAWSAFRRRHAVVARVKIDGGHSVRRQRERMKLSRLERCSETCVRCLPERARLLPGWVC